MAIGDEDDGEGNLSGLSPFPRSPELGSERRDNKRLVLESDYVETPMRTLVDSMRKNDAVDASLRTLADGLSKNASVEASLRTIAESLAKIAEESERKNRIMETAMAKTFDEQIMARPILGLYPHQRQYYELQQNRILKALVKNVDNDVGNTPSETPAATTFSGTSPEAHESNPMHSTAI